MKDEDIDTIYTLFLVCAHWVVIAGGIAALAWGFSQY